MKSEKQLVAFENRLRDRFGELPNEAIELINAIRLRWYARNAGIVKVVIKKGQMAVYFFQTDDERFYSSDIYNNILQYVMENTSTSIMKQSKDNSLMIIFKDVNSIKSGIEIFRVIYEE